MTYTMVVVEGNEDVVIVASPYCEQCLKRKLRVMKIVGIISDEEVRQLVNLKVRCVKVICVCS